MYIKVFLSFVCAMIFSFEASAGVTFITDSKSHSISEQGRAQPTPQANCTSIGYTVTSCPSNMVPVKKCPYSSKYFLDCCPEDYKFRAESCVSAGLRPSKKSCQGLYACE